MSEQSFSQVFREGLWKAHGEKCIYCRRTILFNEMVIDHVIPENLKDSQERLQEVIISHSLASGFDVLGDDNLAPSCAPCNTQKGGDILPPGQVAIIHTKLRNKLGDVYKFSNGRQGARELEGVLRSISRSLEQGKFTIDQLNDALRNQFTDKPVSLSKLTLDSDVMNSLNVDHIDWRVRAGAKREADEIRFTAHAISRAAERDISLVEVINAIKSGLAEATFARKIRDEGRDTTYSIRTKNGLEVIYKYIEDAVHIVTMYHG